MNAELEKLRVHADQLLDELSRDAEHFLVLLGRLRAPQEAGEAREVAEGDVYAWLTQLESSAVQAREAADRADDLELVLLAADHKDVA